MAALKFVVAGVGYTGRRVLTGLPRESSLGISRTAKPGLVVETVDFSDAFALPDMPTPSAVLYTVPPEPDGETDSRLARFLDRYRPTPSRLVYLSTSGVYGDRGGELIDESAEPRPTTPRALRRRAAEQILERWCGDHGVDLTVLRVPGIYGPGRLGLERLAAGEPVLRDADAGPGNRIHVDDLATCCIAAMQPDAPPGIYNVGDGDYRSSAVFSRAVAAIAGLPAPREITLAEAKTRFSAMRLSFLGESRRLDVTRMRTVLGVTPRYGDPEDGIRASLDED